MADDIDDMHHDSMVSFISAAEAEYKMLSGTYEGIDRKAQATTAIAGLFLGGVIALAAHVDSSTSSLVKGLIFVSMLVLLACIVLAIVAMFARTTTTPPTGEECWEAYSTFIGIGDPAGFRKARNAAYNKWAREWVVANNTVETANNKKAFWIFWAQVALLFAAAFTGIFGAVILNAPVNLVTQKDVNVGVQSSHYAAMQSRTTEMPPMTQTITVSPTIKVDTCSSSEPITTPASVVTARKTSVPKLTSCESKREAN